MSIHHFPARVARPCPTWCAVPSHEPHRLWGADEVDFHESPARVLPGGLSLAVVAEHGGRPSVVLYSESTSATLTAEDCRTVAAALHRMAGDFDALGGVR